MGFGPCEPGRASGWGGREPSPANESDPCQGIGSRAHPIVRCTSPYRGDCTYVRFGQRCSIVHFVHISYVRTLTQAQHSPLAGSEAPPPWVGETTAWADG